MSLVTSAATGGEASTNNLRHAGKCAAHDKEDVPRVDCFRLRRAAAAHGGHGVLQLAGHVVGRDHRHVAVFHELEQVGLHATSRDIASAAFAARGELVPVSYTHLRAHETR